jgi:hypothetical protein
MYCSSCGVAIAQGLSYCNHCGARLNRADEVDTTSAIKPESLIQMMGAVFVCGLGAITVFMGVMKAVLGLNIGQILGFAVVLFLMMFVIEGVLIRLLLRGRRGEKPTDRVLPVGPSTRELDAEQAGALPEHLPSVTEHTTRAFEPVYTDRTSN